MSTKYITTGEFESGWMEIFCQESGELLGCIEDTEFTGNKFSKDLFMFVPITIKSEDSAEECFGHSISVGQMFEILNILMELNLEAVRPE